MTDLVETGGVTHHPEWAGDVGEDGRLRFETPLGFRTAEDSYVSVWEYADHWGVYVVGCTDIQDVSGLEARLLLMSPPGVARAKYGK